MQQLKNFSVEINVDPLDDYWSNLRVYQAHDGSQPQLIVERSIRLDNMYEQVEVIIQNALRQNINRLSSQMREARKKGSKDNAI